MSDTRPAAGPPPEVGNRSRTAGDAAGGTGSGPAPADPPGDPAAAPDIVAPGAAAPEEGVAPADAALAGQADGEVLEPPGHPTGRTRLSAAWIAVLGAALVLVLLLVFILQNTRSVRISYFTVTTTLPLGVALLLAAVGGVLIAGVLATLRILQLRRRIRRPGGRER
ncbi:MAG: lipopolysaccharide assembly protein LapA domain-containing protein [Acidimicrobiales bacterium]